jgi:hypothetical protein
MPITQAFFKRVLVYLRSGHERDRFFQFELCFKHIPSLIARAQLFAAINIALGHNSLCILSLKEFFQSVLVQFRSPSLDFQLKRSEIDDHHSR